MSASITVRNLAPVEIVLEPSAYELRSNLIAEAGTITYVSDPLTLEIAVRTLRDIAAFTRGLESARTEAKGPVLDLGRRLDTLARETAAPLEAEAGRLKRLVGDYQEQEEKKRRAIEDARLAEARRLEAERLRIEDEARRKAAAEAAAARSEAERLAAVARAEAGAQALQRSFEAARAAERTLSPAPVVPTAAGLTVKRPWTFEVLDVHILAENNPELVTVTPNRAAILALIRAGARTIPGLRIYEDTRVEVRV